MNINFTTMDEDYKVIAIRKNVKFIPRYRENISLRGKWYKVKDVNYMVREVYIRVEEIDDCDTGGGD